MPGQKRTPDHNVAIVLEIAGVQTSAALIDRWGVIRHRCYARTLRGRPMAASLEPFLRAIDDLLIHAGTNGWPVSGLGFSIPGTLDATGRRLRVIPILPSLNDLPLCDLLEARYSLPVHLRVDVDAALLGEYHFGTGKGYQRLLYLTLNAVAGAAFADHGKFDQTPQAGLGHVAHLPIATGGPRCSCGRRGCINSLISLEAIQKLAQRSFQRAEENGSASGLMQRGALNAQILAEEAMRGDAVALRIYEEIGRCLGAAVARYIGLYQPDALILGGSVLSANEVLFASIQSTLTMHVATITDRPVRIALAHLGSDAALIGASTVLFSQNDKPRQKTIANKMRSEIQWS
ncbi:MAG TPA: ROK family protein [Ktedonobacteraceae bacterium]|nr:ROK family protein [Ktedonobacteraceae bacterium]